MAKPREPLRLDVRKSYTLFIGGAFVRSESGRSDVFGAGADDAATVARASRDDVHAAIAAARAAFAPWAGRAAMDRGRSLYRLAELLDARRADFVYRLRAGTKLDEDEALRETTAAVDRTLWYAGWCDKYASILGSVAAVDGPYRCTSEAGPLGVVGTLAPDEPALLGLVSAVLPALVAGNTVVAVASEIDPRTAVVFAESVATSDLPAGAVNIVTGRRIEIGPELARSGDVDAFDAAGLDAPFAAELERLAASNLKRVRTSGDPSERYGFSNDANDLANVAAFATLKTTWEPTAI